jgi:hypothetical protein
VDLDPFAVEVVVVVARSVGFDVGDPQRRRRGRSASVGCPEPASGVASRGLGSGQHLEHRFVRRIGTSEGEAVRDEDGVHEHVVDPHVPKESPVSISIGLVGDQGNLTTAGRRVDTVQSLVGGRMAAGV